MTYVINRGRSACTLEDGTLKVKWATFKAAQFVASEYKRTTGQHMNAYKCAHCSKYHTGRSRV